MLFAMSALMFFHKQAEIKRLEQKEKDDKPLLLEEIIGSDLGHAYSNPIRRNLHDNAILIRNNPRDGYVRNNRPDGNYSALPKLPQPIPFPSQIMLLTAWRSGGSYISEIFNQHPEVFYFSSPLVLVEGIHPKKKNVFGVDPKENIRNTKIKILDGFFSSECVLPRIEDYWNPLINNYIATHGIECWDDGVCMRYLSNCLKRPPICERDLTGQLDMTPQEVTRLCPFKDKIHYAEMLCMASAVRVAKVGRFTTVQELPKILRDGEALKSIMVVRDPRAILLSRMTKMKGYFEYSNKMIKEICTEWDTILNERINKTWSSPMLIIRYEDFSIYPEPVTKQMYKFAGLYYPESVTNILHELSKHSWEELDLNSLDLHTVKFNNAKQAVTSWVHKLDLKRILVLQESCSNVMRLLGYNTINDKRDLEAAKSLWEMNTPATVEKLGCTTCNWSPSDHNVDGENVEVRKAEDINIDPATLEARKRAEMQMNGNTNNHGGQNEKLNLQQQLVQAIQTAQAGGMDMLQNLGSMAGFQMNQPGGGAASQTGFGEGMETELHDTVDLNGVDPQLMNSILGGNAGIMNGGFNELNNLNGQGLDQVQQMGLMPNQAQQQQMGLMPNPGQIGQMQQMNMPQMNPVGINPNLLGGLQQLQQQLQGQQNQQQSYGEQQQQAMMAGQNNGLVG